MGSDTESRKPTFTSTSTVLGDFKVTLNHLTGEVRIKRWLAGPGADDMLDERLTITPDELAVIAEKVQRWSRV